MKARKTMRERFEESVDRSAGPNGCWAWKGRINKGKPEIGGPRGSLSARRLAMTYAGKPAPADLRVHSTCGDFTCMNPAHLYVETKVERFWKYVDQSGGPDACWPWRGHILKGKEYGQFTIRRGVVVSSHRHAYELENGAIEGHVAGDPATERVIMHTCDNPPCCNPKHMKVGTHGENAADKVAKGRQARGPALRVANLRGKQPKPDLRPRKADIFVDTTLGTIAVGVDVIGERGAKYHVRTRVKAKLPNVGWKEPGYELWLPKENVRLRERPKVPSRKRAA
jgi:hypothetical protein